jgi:putative endopeptidase
MQPRPVRPVRNKPSFAVVSLVVIGAAGVGLASACSGTTTPTPGPKDPPSSSAVVVASQAPTEVVPPMPKKPAEKSTLEQVGLSSMDLDKSTKPCDDFYQFACGGWIRRTEIPSDKARWTRSFSEIDKRNETDMKQILEAALAKKSEKSDEGKLGAFYASCMDEKAIDKAGLKPVQAFIDAAKKVTDLKSLEKAVAKLQASTLSPFFSISKQQDDKDATKMIARFDQAGLGCPIGTTTSAPTRRRSSSARRT